MSGKRLKMSQVKETLRLLLEQGCSRRQAARSLGVSVGFVSRTGQRAKAVGLTWHEASAMTERALADAIYGAGAAAGAERAEPDPAWLHIELMRKGVTLELLHLEYLAEHPDGLKLTAFCSRYRKWKKKKRVTMRQPHKAGEKLFVDFSGTRPHYIDRHTGERVSVELFVATMGASSRTFCVATPSQKSGDFLRANALALSFFGGVPTVIVPDCLKSAVTKSDPYEPTIHRAYSDFARHYGTAIVPARPYRPRDKAKVERAVLTAQRWVLARLRNETFFSLADLNRRIAELVVELDAKPMRTYGGVSRLELFDKVDAPALCSLPSEPFEPFEWKRVRVSRDYHVAIDRHCYSAPYALAHEQLEARLTTRTVELFFRGERVASHVRSSKQHSYTTDKAHMPKAHREWTDGGAGLVEWASSVGPHTELLVKRIFARAPIPQQGWRSARGLKRLSEKYPAERIEEACKRACRFGARSYKPVQRILKLDVDLRPDDESEGSSSEDVAIEHDQVRGPDYFH